MNLWAITQVFVLVAVLPAAAAVLYLLVLTVAACLHPGRRNIDGIFRGDRLPLHRFIILIPAHNEELLLGDVLRRLGGLSYPGSHVETVVIADNCDDRTAEVAAGAGATVLKRNDPEHRGKGQAAQLGHAGASQVLAEGVGRARRHGR